MNLLQSIAVVGAQGSLMSEGLATLVVGMGVVFVALTALIIILQTMGNIFDNIGKKDAAKKANEQVAVVQVEPEPAPETSEVDDLELVAVITAALAASMGTSVEGLQVRSIRKTNNAWGMSGRTEQLYN